MKKLLTGLVIGLVISCFYYFNTFSLFEKDMIDRLTTEERQGDLRIKILAIDDASLNEVGRWPWSREVIANVADALLEAGASAVWLDLVFSEPAENAVEDEKIQSLLDSYDNFYLSSYFNFSMIQADVKAMEYTSYQEPIYQISNDQLGHINVFQDSDRVVRKGILGIPKEDGEMIPAISVRLANLLLADDNQVNYHHALEKWSRGSDDIQTNARNEVIFSYASNPSNSSFDVFSIKDVINQTIPASSFKNSLVLIGTYTVGLQDQYLTPMSRAIPMNGVEIHANLIQSFIEGYFFSELPLVYGLFLMIGLSLISYLLIQHLRSKYTILLVIGLLISYIVTFLVVFNQYKMILPLFYPLLAIIFSYIASVVTQFVEEQLEKTRITNIFGRYVSKNIVQELIETKDEVTLVGERKEVTLMFVDMRGFTSLSEQMEPEEVVEVLNQYLELCSQAIFDFEGTIDKFMGDGIMVIYGAPVSQADHALRAVQTAIKMQEQGKPFTERLEKKYGRAVAFGIGINSGPAVVGNIGSEERLDYTAIGDTVNLAARLESNAKPHQILLSASTYEHVKETINCRSLTPIQVKGKVKPVEIYEAVLNN